MSNDDLWHQLRDFEFHSAAASLSFEQRLARENNWGLDFARAVIVEYKRFLYLIAITGQELTPSDEVDQAWHLHLVYTRSYWHSLCDGILGFPLHHQPTQGGAAQQQHYRQVYATTLECYREHFGEPPAAIWPEPEKRFQAADAYTRVNRSLTWLIPKPPISYPLVWLTVFSLVTLTACSLTQGDDGFWFWLKVGVGVWGAYIVIKTFNNLLGGGRGGGRGSGCSSGGCSGCGGCGGGD
jgi:hypothetical protein